MKKIKLKNTFIVNTKVTTDKSSLPVNLVTNGLFVPSGARQPPETEMTILKTYPNLLGDIVDYVSYWLLFLIWSKVHLDFQFQFKLANNV